MTVNPVDAVDERAHAPGSEELWSESWYFDFFAADGSIGGWVRIGLYPNLGVAWYHAFVVGPGRPIVAVADLEVPLPARGSLELRSHGLWAEHTCETALDHWSLGNEAFAISVDDPAELYQREPRGEQVPMGLDLEWETDGKPHHYLYTTRYEIPCRVHGEVLVGDERIELDGWGQRDHSWGERDWWKMGWVWHAGRLEDGTRFHGSDIRIPDVDVGFGYVQSAEGDGEGTNSVHATEELGQHGLPVSASIEIADLALAIEPIAFAPTLLTWKDKVDRFPRALCRVSAADGRLGLAWTEWNQPQ
jgi:hypothetical protein